MPFPTHNKYHRRLLKRLHEKGAEFESTLVLKASGVTPAGNMRQQRVRRAGRALGSLRRHGLVKILRRGKDKKKYMLTFEGWVYYATVVLEEPDGQEKAGCGRAGHTEQPTNDGGSVVG